MINIDQYVPVLKWRQGEYQALLRLDDDAKSKIVPLVVIPPIEYDFEEQMPKKNIDEHLEYFGNRVDAKWGDRLFLLDLHESLEDGVMSTGEMPIQFVMRALESFSCNYIPVVSMSKSKGYIQSIKGQLKNLNGVALRLTLSELAHPDTNALLSDLFLSLGVEWEEVDLILDLVRPDTFSPYDGFGKLLAFHLNNLVGIDSFRSLVVIGTSLNLKEVKKPGGEFDRDEWVFYKALINDHLLGELVPAFGDYSIDTPEFQDIDFRLMNPAGKIIYTCDETWLVTKGGAFRDDRSQMVSHCKKIINSPHYLGKDFSWGDEKIYEMANGKARNYGNLGTWKQVGVSHHLTKTVHQLTNFFDY